VTGEGLVPGFEEARDKGGMMVKEMPAMEPVVEPAVPSVLQPEVV
jgi:hypothetical protein